MVYTTIKISIYYIAFKTNKTNMGIKDFSKVFPPTSKYTDLAEFKGSTFAVDAMIMIFKYSLAGGKVALLTNAANEPTLVYNGILSFVCNLKKQGIKQIWVFDSVMGSVYKDKAYKERTARKDNAMKELEDLYAQTENKDEVRIDQLEKVTFKLGKNVIANIKFILNKLKIRWIECGPNIEAEHMCAELTRQKIADYAYTADTDAIIFGAVKTVRMKDEREGNKTKKMYYVYELKDLLKKHSLTKLQLAQAAIALGCDFVEKVKGVGPASVITKVLSGNIVYTDHQKEIINMFLAPVEVPKINKSEVRDVDGLVDWFVNAMQFKRDRVKDMINKAFVTAD